MSEDEKLLLMPGDRLSTEEEYMPAGNAFAEEGIVYSSGIGVKEIAEGKIAVKIIGRKIKKLKKGMYAIGSVVGDLKSVIFLKLDDLEFNDKEFFAPKDGKIVLPRRGPRPPRSDEITKPCKLGDIVLAKILFNDPDVYTMGIMEDIAGVVYSNCEVCNNPLSLGSKRNVLQCKECKHTEFRKVSSAYGDFNKIKAILEENTKI